MRERLAHAQGLGEHFRGGVECYQGFAVGFWRYLGQCCWSHLWSPGFQGPVGWMASAREQRRSGETGSPAQAPRGVVPGELPFFLQDGKAIGPSLPFLTRGCHGPFHGFSQAHAGVRPTPVSFDAFIKSLVGTQCLKWLMEIFLQSNKVTAFLPIEMGAARGSSHSLAFH